MTWAKLIMTEKRIMARESEKHHYETHGWVMAK